MKSERTFFEHLAQQFSPGWSISIDDQLPLSEIQLSSRSARLYLVNTSNDWIAASAFSANAFREIHEHARSNGFGGKGLHDAAGKLIMSLGSAQAAGPETLETCMEVVAAAIAESKAFEVQSKQPGTNVIAGHWIYISYRGHDASLTSRPVFLKAKEPGFLDPDTLRSVVRQVIAIDAQKSTQVSIALKKAGGAIFHPAYEVKKAAV